MLSVHLAHYHVVLELRRSLCLAPLEKYLGLLKATLLNRCLLNSLDTLIKMLYEGP